MIGYINSVFEYFVPSKLIKGRNHDQFLFCRVHFTSYFVILCTSSLVLLLNLLSIISSDIYRIQTSVIIFLFCLANVLGYKFYSDFIIKHVNIAAAVQIIFFVGTISYILFQSGTLMNSAIFWLSMLVLTTSFYVNYWCFFLSLFLSLGVGLFFFLSFETQLLENVIILNSASYGVSAHTFMVDFVFVLFYSLLISVSYKISKIELDNLKREEEKRLERERNRLIKEEKFSSLGKMAGNLAHEINNPIFSTQGDVYGLQRILVKEKVDSPESLEVVERIEKKLLSISEIIRTVSSFAKRDQNHQSKEVRLVELIDRSLNFHFEQIKLNEIDLHFNVNRSVTIVCDPTAITQIFSNLIKNSIESLELLPQKEKFIQIKTDIDCDQGVIRIFYFDSGPGVDHHHVSQIFEPFFSTKDTYQGTGLGLNIARSFARQHQGDLIYFDQRLSEFSSQRLDFMTNTWGFVLILPVEK